MSPGENVNKVFECDIQGKCLAECYVVLLSPTVKIAVIKMSCTVQYEVLDIELDGGVCQDTETTINRTAQLQAYVFIQLRRNLHTFIDTHTETTFFFFFKSCRLMCFFPSPLSCHLDLQPGSGEASV